MMTRRTACSANTGAQAMRGALKSGFYPRCGPGGADERSSGTISNIDNLPDGLCRLGGLFSVCFHPNIRRISVIGIFVTDFTEENLPGIIGRIAPLPRRLLHEIEQAAARGMNQWPAPHLWPWPFHCP